MWKKVILLFFIVCLLSALLIGCGGVIPPTPEEPIEPIIPETTKVVDEETIQEIASVTEDQSIIIFEKSTPQLEELAVGDIIAMGVTENTPEGLLRKVTKVTKGGKDSSEVVVETEFTTLEEAIEQGEFYFNEALKAEDAKEPVCYVKGIEFIRDISTIKDSKIQILEFNYNINAIIYDVDNNPNTKEDNITLTGQLSFDYNLLFSGKIGFPHLLKELNFQNKVKMEKNLGVIVGGSVKLFSQKIDLWTHDCGLKVVWIGWVPIVLHPKITISADVNGEIFTKVTAEITDKDTYTAGIKFDNGSWQPISSHENYFSPPSLSLSTGGAVTFGVGPKLECKVDGVVGPFCKTTLYGKVIADIYANPWWKIYVGIMAKAGVKIEIFSKVYASTDLTVLDLEKIIAQADGPFITNTDTVSNVVAISWTDHIPENLQNIEHLINVFWDPYPEASGYKVYRNVNGVVEGEPVYSGPGELLSDKNVVQWHDTNIVVGNTYSYYVTAYGDGWETAPSQETGTINSFLPPIYLVGPSAGETINNPTPVFKWSPVGSNPEGCKNFGTTELWVIDLTADKELVWQIIFDDMTTFSATYNQDGQASPLIPGHSYGWQVTSYGYAENMEDAISQSEYWEFTYTEGE